MLGILPILIVAIVLLAVLAWVGFLLALDVKRFFRKGKR